MVISPFWNLGTTLAAGAVTWVDGNGPRVGQVLADNSLVGTTENDVVGHGGVAALSNGHYVVGSHKWDHLQTPDVGAATWRNGNGPSPGVVAANNSLIGTLPNDLVGSGSIVALNNGHYVVGAAYADLGTSPPVRDVGAATWCSGTGVTSGVVSINNSFAGLSRDDYVGDRVVALSNGNYVVATPYFDAFGREGVGAVTWGNGTAPSAGFVSSANSLVGSAAESAVGCGVSATSDGGYVVSSPYVDFVATNGGVITFGQPDGSTVGGVLSVISIFGEADGGGARIVYDYDRVRERLIVGLPADNRVQIVSTNPNLVFRDGLD